MSELTKSNVRVIYICFLVFTIAIYGIVIYFIIKRRNYSCISIRSPTLLIVNNVSTFLILLNIMIIQIILENRNIYYTSCLFYPMQILCFVSFFCRSQRILSCCKINSDETADKKEFYKKRHLFQEKYYIKIMAIIFGISVVAIIILDLSFGEVVAINPLWINRQHDDANRVQRQYNLQSVLYTVLTFAEECVLATYVYLIFINDIKQKIRNETLIFAILQFIFSANIGVYDFFIRPSIGEGEKWYLIYILIVCALLLYATLGVNGIFPVVLSYCYQTSIGYHFSPQLMNNLYLFLSNEDCYGAFSEFLSHSQIDTFYLRVYTHIMKLKLEFIAEESMDYKINEARLIMDTYFKEHTEDENFNLTATDIKDKISKIGPENCKEDMFDEALKYTYIKLGKKYVEFKKTDEFAVLTEHLNANSYIQCKMCNTGLINKF